MTAHNEGTPQKESHLLDNVFQDGQGNNSITAQDMRDFVASTRYLQPIGWEFILDDGQGDMTLVDGTPQQLKIYSYAPEELRYPSTFPDIWDKTEHKIAPLALNAFGIIRLSFSGVFTGGTAPHIDIWLDVGSNPIPPVGTGILGDYGSGSNVIYTDSPNFAKAQSDPQAFNFVVPLFSGADFQTNGGNFIIQSHLADIDISGITLTSAAIFVPNPAGEG